ALAGGPIGKLCDGDLVRIIIDRKQLVGSVDFVGELGTTGSHQQLTPQEGAANLATRPARTDLAPDPNLPAETRLWAALPRVGGVTWGGCVYDVERIIEALAPPAS